MRIQSPVTRCLIFLLICGQARESQPPGREGGSVVRLQFSVRPAVRTPTSGALNGAETGTGEYG